MKQIAFLSLTAWLLAACGSNPTPAPVADTPAQTPRSEAYQAGLALVVKNDCLTCHLVEEKNVGPAYRDIAAKYEPTAENITRLAGKIRKGGSGVWGEVPMTPHPQVSQEDAETMVKYIFELRK
ncbi:MAG TPA: c-type cytochrome [Lacibacter sp.]|nr:c-type cytochrome [Lacibacter sp.]HMO88365.1 c-type cytochrome [Lacibacter sp.]HMP87872.1 c-type cytochrome [Lacibacter sp.]